jgi:hypothetical protein
MKINIQPLLIVIGIVVVLSGVVILSTRSREGYDINEGAPAGCNDPCTTYKVMSDKRTAEGKPCPSVCMPYGINSTTIDCITDHMTVPDANKKCAAVASELANSEALEKCIIPGTYDMDDNCVKPIIESITKKHGLPV